MTLKKLNRKIKRFLAEDYEDLTLKESFEVYFRRKKKKIIRYLPKCLYNSTHLAVPADADKMLQNIRTFLELAKHNEGDKLWKIMSAFRGPDSEDHDLKMATTAIIRNKALGVVADRFGLSNGKDKDKFKEMRRNIKTRTFFHGEEKQTHPSSSHFEYHSRKAFKLLGLDWGDSNEV